MLYRLAEMMETRAADLAARLLRPREVERAIDRVVWYAGWADKLPQVLGGSNPVAGPYFNFTVPEPTGVVAIAAPRSAALLEGLVSRIAPAIVSGNTAVVVASEPQPLAALELAEAIATSDLPGGVVNLLTGFRAELAPVLAGAHGRQRDRRHRRGRRDGRARGARRRQRQARRPAPRERAEPVGDLRPSSSSRPSGIRSAPYVEAARAHVTP